MTKNETLKTVGIVLSLIGAVILIALGVGVNNLNETTQEHKILSIDKVESTEGDSDGFKTRVYYIVSTDKGQPDSMLRQSVQESRMIPQYADDKGCKCSNNRSV